MDKPAIRQEMLSKRSHMDLEEVAEASATICKKLISYEPIKQAQNIITYYAVRNEVDPSAFAKHAAKQRKNVALPIIYPNKDMSFHKYDPEREEELQDGIYGIPTPPENAEKISPDIILVPVVAFDSSGYRIGYGGGFYDKALSEIITQTENHQTKACLFIGLAYHWQQVENIECELHDVPMDVVITDKDIIKF